MILQQIRLSETSRFFQGSPPITHRHARFEHCAPRFERDVACAAYYQGGRMDTCLRGLACDTNVLGNPSLSVEGGMRR